MIVDTNALSAWRDGESELLAVLLPADSLALPVISIAEYGYGVSRSTRRREAEEWLDLIVNRIPILPITLATAWKYAEICATLMKKGRPIPANDIWIASLALEHGLPVLSRDTHFDFVDGVTRISW